MAWTNNTFAFGSVLTSTKMGLIQDNFAALATGASGAPKIETAAVTSGILINSLYLGFGATNNNTNLMFGTTLSNVTSAGYFGANIAIGNSVLSLMTGGYYNVGIGAYALSAVTSGSANIAIGRNAMPSATGAVDNIGIGTQALLGLTTGSTNIAIGGGSSASPAMQKTTTGESNVSIGHYSMTENLTGQANVALGNYSLSYLIASSGNTAIGNAALQTCTSGSNNTAIGRDSGIGVSGVNNSTCLGYNTAVTGSNQVQLGDSATTTYVYGTVQNRSDARDKIIIGDTIFGLEFIKKLRPRDYRYNYRERYKERQDDGTIKEIPNDGSRAGKRPHHGLIAQELKQVLDDMGLDFGGYQDHSVAGGKDVLSIGYDELIAPMIKAIQELAAKVERLEAKLDG